MHPNPSYRERKQSASIRCLFPGVTSKSICSLTIVLTCPPLCSSAYTDSTPGIKWNVSDKHTFPPRHPDQPASVDSRSTTTSSIKRLTPSPDLLSSTCRCCPSMALYRLKQICIYLSRNINIMSSSECPWSSKTGLGATAPDLDGRCATKASLLNGRSSDRDA